MAEEDIDLSDYEDELNFNSDDTFLTSDFLIYTILKHSDSDFLKLFNIQFPDGEYPNLESNTINVGLLDNDLTKETMNSEHYKAIVEVYITTKKLDYKQATRLLNTAVKIIKRIIRESDKLKPRNPRIIKVNSEYGSQYRLKGKHILIKCDEVEFKPIKDDTVECIGKIDAEVNNHD